jgi:hypothetical protein
LDGLLDLGKTGWAGVAGGEFHGRDFPSVVLAGGIARGEHGLGKGQRGRLRREGGGRSLSLCSMCAPGVLSAAAACALRRSAAAWQEKVMESETDFWRGSFAGRPFFWPGPGVRGPPCWFAAGMSVGSGRVMGWEG